MINSENLSLQPEDGNIFDEHIVMVESEFIDIADESEGCRMIIYLEHVFQVIIRLLQLKKIIIRQSLQEDRSASSPITWPIRGQNLINEFSTEGYFSCAFPSLFPSGAADFLSTSNTGNYFKHLLLYNDGQFAKHCCFRSFALNTEMRYHAL